MTETMSSKTTKSSSMRRCAAPACSIVSALVLLLHPSWAWPELTSDHMAVIVNRNSAGSEAVARHYVERRGLTAGQIIALDLHEDETITRDDYENTVVRPLRQILEERHLAPRIRCLVTTYGVPIRVAMPTPSAAEERWMKDAAVRKEQTLASLTVLEERVRALAAASAEHAGPPRWPDGGIRAGQ